MCPGAPPSVCMGRARGGVGAHTVKRCVCTVRRPCVETVVDAAASVRDCSAPSAPSSSECHLYGVNLGAARVVYISGCVGGQHVIIKVVSFQGVLYWCPFSMSFCTTSLLSLPRSYDEEMVRALCLNCLPTRS